MPLLALILLLALNAWFVTAGFTMVSARCDQTEPDAVSGSTSARYALRGIENVSVSLAATRLGITACSLLIGAVDEPVIAHLFEPYMTVLGLPTGTTHVVTLVLALLIVTFSHMVVGEMVPKNIATAAPSPTAKLVATPLYVTVRVLKPVIWAMNTAVNIVVRKVLRVAPKDEVDSSFAASQVQDFVIESGRQGFLDNDEFAFLHKALGFEYLTAVDATMECNTLVAIGSNATVVDIEKLSTHTRFSRFPITDTDGSFIGYIHVRDSLSLDDGHRDRPFPRNLIRTFASVSPDVKLQSVVWLMQREQARFALVTEENSTSESSVNGIAALEDVLEELIGEVCQATA